MFRFSTSGLTIEVEKQCNNHLPRRHLEKTQFNGFAEISNYVTISYTILTGTGLENKRRKVKCNHAIICFKQFKYSVYPFFVINEKKTTKKKPKQDLFHEYFKNIYMNSQCNRYT